MYLLSFPNKVYCCRQADALICLHQNGAVSLHYCLPTSKHSFTEDVFSHPPHDLKYYFLCESKSLRRGRNFTVVAMSVDPSTELGITVATSDGRLQVSLVLYIAVDLLLSVS